MRKNSYSKAMERARQIFSELFTRRSFTLPPELRFVDRLDSGLRSIDKRWPLDKNDVDTARPVFLFSAGWRSGSTLLQRLLCSTGELVMWGEPLGNSAIIPRMSLTLSPITKRWPPDDFFSHNQNLDTFSSSWIANVTPEFDSLRLAHRAFFDEWLAKSAVDTYGVSNWGLKEVRLTIEHAKYLKWVYPNARFVFIYRNLFDAYRSWRGNIWADTWPGYFSWSPIAYARHWKLLLTGYINEYRNVDGYLVKYEDLVAGKVNFEELAEHVGIKSIDITVLEQRIASPNKTKRNRSKKWISPIERIILNLIGGKLLKQLGYK